MCVCVCLSVCVCVCVRIFGTHSNSLQSLSSPSPSSFICGECDFLSELPLLFLSILPPLLPLSQCSPLLSVLTASSSPVPKSVVHLRDQIGKIYPFRWESQSMSSPLKWAYRILSLLFIHAEVAKYDLSLASKVFCDFAFDLFECLCPFILHLFFSNYFSSLYFPPFKNLFF